MPEYGQNKQNEDCSAVLREALLLFADEDRTDKTTIIIPPEEELWQRRPGFFFHFHYEIFFQMQGGCTFYFPRRKTVIKAGDILLVPPGVPHAESAFSVSGKPFRNILFTVAEKWSTLHLAECGMPGANSADKPEPVYREKFSHSRNALLFATAAAVHHSAEDITAEGKRFRLDLLRSMCRVAHYDLGPTVREVIKPEDVVGDTLHYKVRQVKDIIDQRGFAEVPDVATLATRVGCTPNYLSALFRAETGETLKCYITRLRMEYARRLLDIAPSSSIAEVAWSCGFHDAAYFSRIFERYSGCKPNEYRRRK